MLITGAIDRSLHRVAKRAAWEINGHNIRDLTPAPDDPQPYSRRQEQAHKKRAITARFFHLCKTRLSG